MTVIQSLELQFCSVLSIEVKGLFVGGWNLFGGQDLIDIRFRQILDLSAAGVKQLNGL